MAKDFKNPTEFFLSNSTIENSKPLDLNEEAPIKKKTNPELVETKSKRIQVLIQPSTHSSLKAIAQRENTSTNDIINIALKEYIEREK